MAEIADNGAEREKIIDRSGHQQITVRVGTGRTKTTYTGHYDKALPGYLEVAVCEPISFGNDAILAQVQLKRLRTMVVIPATSYKDVIKRAGKHEPFRAVEFSFLRGFEPINPGVSISVVRKAPELPTNQELIANGVKVRSQVDLRDSFQVLETGSGLRVVAAFEKDGRFFDGTTSWELNMPTPDPESILETLKGPESDWSKVGETFHFGLQERTTFFEEPLVVSSPTQLILS